MEWLDAMNRAVEYVEANLLGEMDYRETAREACCSVYHFNRLFSFVTGIPLSEYVRRRRLTLAAFELQSGGVKVIDVALKYGYESPEAFARAFQLMHGLTPSQARSRGARLKAYARISFQIKITGDAEMNYRIEQKEAFDIYGAERIFDTENGRNLADIPQYWLEMIESGALGRLVDSTGGAANDERGLAAVNAVCGCCDTGGTTFPYMLFAFRTPKSRTEGYSVYTVPAATWAIFTTQPHTEAETSRVLQELIRRVYTEWLPTSGFRKLDGFELELYFTKPDGSFYEEAWIRVEKP